MEAALRAPVRVERGQEKTEYRQNNILKYNPIVGENHTDDCVDTSDGIPGTCYLWTELKSPKSLPDTRRNNKGMWMTGDSSSQWGMCW